MKGKVLTTLFALPFAAVGLWAGYSVTSNVWDYWEMRSWAPVQAELLTAGYSSHAGDDSTTYEAYATYRYRYAGQSYSGSRVGISGGADNIGSYQTDTGSRLSAAQSRGEPITIYVDPQQPSSSIIDRDLRLGMIGFKSIFLLIFGGVGFGLAIAAWRIKPDPDLSDPAFVDSPWKANTDWRADGIRSGSRAAMIGAWVFAGFWNLVSAPLPFLLVDEIIEKKNYPALLGLLFPVVGVGLLVWAVRRSAEWRRFGAVPVVLDPFPGAIGGQVGGYLDIRLPYDSTTRFEMTLTCIKSYMSGSGKNRSRRENAVWQDEQTVAPESGPLGSRVRFRFDVPADLTPADALRSESRYHLWRLSVQADLPGTDFNRDYDIPVYATGETSATAPRFADDRGSGQREAELAARVRERLGSTGSSTLHQPAGRHLGSAIMGFLFGAIFAGVGAFLVIGEGQTVFGGLFGLIGVLVGLSFLYLGLNSLTVTGMGSQLTSTRRLLGIPVRTTSMQRHEIRRIDAEQSMSSQSGGRHTIYYRLVARNAAGDKMTLATGLKGMSEANTARTLIAQQFGLSIEREEPRDTVDFDVLAADR